MDNVKFVERMIVTKLLVDDTANILQSCDSYEDLDKSMAFNDLYYTLDRISEILPCYQEVEERFPEEFSKVMDEYLRQSEGLEE